MAPKSPLRVAREAAGISRGEMAERLGTTVHKYWHCEMPPFDGPPDVLQAACALLGIDPNGVATTHEGERQAKRGPSGGLRWWRCDRCGHEEEAPIGASAMSHHCPKYGKKLWSMRPVIGEQRDE